MFLKVMTVKNALSVTIAILNIISVCNGCHDLTILCLNFSRSDAIHLLKNFVIDNCGWVYRKCIFAQKMIFCCYCFEITL